MTNEDYERELAEKRAENATLIAVLQMGRDLMHRLAQACDDAVLAGEPFPDELNDRIRNWCCANDWTTALQSGLPDTKRAAAGQEMQWHGITVEVEGIATVAASGNWHFVDGTVENEPMPPNA